MKTHPITPALLTLLGATLVGAPLVVRAGAAPATMPSATAEDAKAAKTFSGKVEAKSDTSLTVAGRTVKLNGSTRCSKGGAAVASGDIKVGDQVTVTTSDDGETAVAVDVTGGE